MFLNADTITDDQIRYLFADHCECRPLNTARLRHSHDCEDEVTTACRAALHGRTRAERRRARGACAHFISRRPTYQDYMPDGCP